MSSQFQESVEVSWMDRILQSLMNSILGLALFAFSFVLLWWNEGNVLAERLALDEIKQQIVSIDAANTTNANDGKWIYTVAPLYSEEYIKDPLFTANLSYVKLQRTVEMYQWVEKSKTSSSKHMGGSETRTKTYSYALEWKTGTVLSKNFKEESGHQNPTNPIDNENFAAKKVSFGQFQGAAVVNHLPMTNKVELSPERLGVNTNVLTAQLGGQFGSPTICNGMLYFGSCEEKLGALRVIYHGIKVDNYGVIAKQMDPHTLGPIKTSNSKEKFLAAEGDVTSGQLLKAEKVAQDRTAWMLRLVGFVMMWAGLAMFLAPIGTILDVIPFFGTLADFATAAFSFVVAAVFSPLTIMISWIAHRPLVLGVIVVSLIAAGAFWILQQHKAGSSSSNKNAA